MRGEEVGTGIGLYRKLGFKAKETQSQSHRGPQVTGWVWWFVSLLAYFYKGRFIRGGNTETGGVTSKREGLLVQKGPGEGWKGWSQGRRWRLTEQQGRGSSSDVDVGGWCEHGGGHRRGIGTGGSLRPKDLRGRGGGLGPQPRAWDEQSAWGSGDVWSNREQERLLCRGGRAGRGPVVALRSFQLFTAVP